MYHNRATNRKLNRLHERCFRIIYNNESSFKMLIEKDNFVSIHDRNIQCLAIEMYKVTRNHHLYSAIFSHKKNSCPYNLRLSTQFSRPLMSVFHGVESILNSYLGQLSWTVIWIVTKTYLILMFLKAELKNGNLRPQNCPSRFCKTLAILSNTFLELVLLKLLFC